MDLMTNTFKAKLREDTAQIGLWLGLAGAYPAELAANAGFDWLLIDAEHAPNTIPSILAQLQAIAPYASHPIVRPPDGSTVGIKQLLDLGAQTLLVPMVDTAEQAEGIVRAAHYPPGGVRGVGSALARASRWNSIPDYLQRADEEVCLLLQVETVAGLENLEAIANVRGVDGVFIGPADLAAAMGHLGNPGHPEVQGAIENGIRTIRSCGKAAGILAADEKLARRYLELGANFVAVGVDTSILTRALKSLAATFKSGTPVDDSGTDNSVY